VYWYVRERPTSNIHICFPFDEESNDVEMADLGRHVKRGLLVLVGVNLRDRLSALLEVSAHPSVLR
jgi:hypothetical protein